MTPERLITLCAEHGVDWRAMSPSTGERALTASDAALACGPFKSRSGRIVRLGREAEYAFRYRWARDGYVYPDLRRFLHAEAGAIGHREKWPVTVKRLQLEADEFADEVYVDDLVDLALYEEHHLWKLKPGLWHHHMRVQPFVWDRQMSRRYEALRAKVDYWCGDAHSHIARKLRTGISGENE